MSPFSRISTILVLSVCSPILGQEVKDSKAVAPSKKSIYDPKVDAREAVKTAALRARADDKRVLVMFGGDWCGWCHKLHSLFETDANVRKVLSQEYVLVMVDTKAPNAESLLDECKGDFQSVGYPYLAVLDGDAKLIARQKTDPLEVGDHHDPNKVTAFLDQWATPKKNADVVLANGLARRKARTSSCSSTSAPPGAGGAASWTNSSPARTWRRSSARISWR